MNVLRHDHVSGDNKFVLFSDSLQCVFKEILCFGLGKIRETPVTTEGEKVHITAVLITNESPRHEKQDTRRSLPGPKIRTWGTQFQFISFDGDLRHLPVHTRIG